MNIFENREFPLVKNTSAQLALVLIVALLLWATGAPLFLDHVKAANLSNVNDVLTNSANSAFSGHTINYLNSTTTAALQTINIQLDPDTHFFTEVPDLATSSHFSISYFNGASTTIPIVATCGVGATLTTSSAYNGNITITLCAGTSIPANSNVMIQMGTSSQTFFNPAATNSYRVTVGGTQLNSGETRVAILPNVTLTAAISTTFTFTVQGLATSTVVNNATTTASSTATALPFGTLVSGTTTTLGQQLNVTTNARNGFIVTVQENQPPTSGAGAIINAFLNGSTSTVPIPWSLPSGILNSYNTYSHIGLTSNDLDEGTGEFAGATSTKYVGNFLTSPRIVFDNNGPADGITQNQGTARVAYSISISPLQAAGNDYTNTLTYVATPTF
jgi:hypothetical protein